MNFNNYYLKTVSELIDKIVENLEGDKDCHSPESSPKIENDLEKAKDIYRDPFAELKNKEVFYVRAFGVREEDINITLNEDQTEVNIEGCSTYVGQNEDSDTVDTFNEKVEAVILLDESKRYTALDYEFVGGFVVVTLTTKKEPKNKIKINKPKAVEEKK